MEKKVYFPDYERHGIKMSDECKDFLTKVLNKNPKERLGSKGDVKEILDHPWFKDLDPEKVL